MKKFLRLLTAITSLVVITFNGLSVTGCSCSTTYYNRDYYVSLLRYRNLPANSTDFIKYYEQQLKTSADESSNQEFDNLYDNNSGSRPFASYHQLNQDLANTQMGPKKCQVNWPHLLQSVNLTGSDLIQAENGILRFNNILAKVYGTTNTLRLVQSNALVATKDNIIAYTRTNKWGTPVWQRMWFGHDFVDTSLINEQYQFGFWASNNIDSAIIHEYGHALSNFLYANDRDTFNNNWNANNTKTNLETNNDHTNLSITHINKWHDSKPITDRAQLLIEFLNDKGHEYALAHNLSSYYDPENNPDPQLTNIFPYILLQSNYGRSYLKTGFSKDDFFAEAFVTWMLTPESQRGWNWQLFNDFFLNRLRKYIEIK